MIERRRRRLSLASLVLLFFFLFSRKRANETHVPLHLSSLAVKLLSKNVSMTSVF
jgi:hypothetical protein